MSAMTKPGEPAVVSFDVQWLLALASQHADYSADLQCEVDDLRSLVRLCWAVLTQPQRQVVIGTEEVLEAIDGEFMATAPGVGDDGAQWLIDCAKAHGATDDPDHDAGDLQGFVKAMWREMSAEQHRAVIEDDELFDIAELGGCERFLVKKGEAIDDEDWALAVAHFSLDHSLQYNAQQMADYMNAFTLQEAIESEDAHTQHPMKRRG